MNKAVFLDRDGVVNRELGHYCETVADFEILDGVAEGIKMLKEAGYLVIIISNQGGIAKGLYTEEDVMQMHQKLVEHLAKNGTQVDDFYFCPHHDSISQCECRKPKSLLFQKAIEQYNIDPNLSFVIGDSQRDIEAGKNVGVKGVLIASNSKITSICQQIIAG